MRQEIYRALVRVQRAKTLADEVHPHEVLLVTNLAEAKAAIDGALDDLGYFGDE